MFNEDIASKLVYPNIDTKFNIDGLLVGMSGGRALELKRTNRFKW